jgi:Type I phosphodiesterase / nucleotide pyrophosphatase
LLLGALPGVVLAAYATGLLFFLNPEIDPHTQAVLRGVALYSFLFGSCSGLVSALLTGRSPARVRALLPWSLSAVLALAAISTWVHASVYSYFLPPGLNVRLIKAAILLSVLALISGFTATLHSLGGRTYGARSRMLLALLSIAVLYVMLERRAAFDPPPAVAPLPSETDYRKRPELWVIGLEGATLDAILPLAKQGQLPFFARLLDEGSSASVDALPPLDKAALWTTLATGRLPYNHRVLSERVYPAGILSPGDTLRLVPPGYRWWGFFGAASWPIDSRQRHHSTLWEILSRLDIPAGVVGWPASYPPHRPLAFAFSDRYFAGDLRQGGARPAELAERGVLFRVAADHLDHALVDPLGPPLSYPFLQALASDVWRESLTEFMLDQRTEVDAVFLRLEGLAAVSRRYYGGFAAVQFDGAQDAKRQEAARLLAAYYRHLDRWLARLEAKRPANRVLVIVSAYGFREPHGWHRLTTFASNRALEGSAARAPDGMLLVRGPGIQAGRRLPQAQLVDILPTLLYGVGLPSARDLDGRVLTGVFESSFLARQPLTFVPSYETLNLEEAPPPGLELMITDETDGK